ncbi:MAG: ATP-binding protein [Cellulosilyticaceae bacterium]
MKKTRITTKLFVITSLSLLLLLGLQLVFQGLFLDKFYKNQKQTILENNLQTLKDDLLTQDTRNINDALLMFSQKFGLVSGIVNLYGFPMYGFDTAQPFIQVKMQDGEQYKVYLEGFSDNPELKPLLKQGETIAVEGMETNAEKKEIYPYKLEINRSEFYRKAIQIKNLQMLEKTIISSSTSRASTIPAIDIQGTSTKSVYRNLTGTIELLYIPEEDNYRNMYRQNKLLEEVQGFLQKSTQENASLKLQEIIVYEKADTFIGVKNVVGIIPFVLNQEPVLLVAMMSLEQIQEAMDIMMRYTIIIFVMVYVLALGAAYVYAKRITKPLVELSNITTSITNLDFSHVCVIRSEDEIGELAKNINSMSRKLETTLERLNNDIEQKELINKERKQFIADISHELKTPLTVLKGTCEGITNGLYDVSKTNHIETMLYHINDMSDLVQELLDLSRLDKAEELKIEVFDITNSLLRIHKKLKPLAQERKLNISLETEECIVRGDKKKLEVVLKNIYTNAILYTPIGKEIKIWIEQKEEVVEVNIENEGARIDKDKLDKIWEAFYRIEPSRNKTLGGSGLGLYMVKQILEKHHECYGIENTDKGVRVWFQIHR